MQFSMGSSSNAHASTGFYRPPSTERGRWSSPFSGGGDPAAKRWVPKAFVSPEARQWAFKAAALAILTATSVALHGRIVEGLQDLAGFHLAQVKVTGAHYLSEDEVTAASDLKPGDGMFRLDLKTAAEKVGRLPWVKRVMFERRLPQNILISVEERKPAALVDSGALWGVDEEGRVLPPSTALLNEDLPLLSGVSVRPEDAGNTRSAESFKPALEFLAFLKKEDPALYSDVSEVHATQADDLRVTFLDGTMARFGSDAGEDELRHMASVLSDLAAKNRHASLLDFRFKDQVVVHTR
jgi:cell division protein FtsQ